jgi:hypothetical protein
MTEENKDNFNIDDLVKRLERGFQIIQSKDTLKELFEKRINVLNINPTNVQNILKPVECLR